MTEHVLKFGLLPARPDQPRVTLRDHVSVDAVLSHPRTKTWMGKNITYPMFGNDQYGDCVWAEIGHHLQADSTYANGVTITPTTDALLKGYHDVTGFDPDDPSTDRGTVIADALDYWRKTGIVVNGQAHKILAHFTVDVSNDDEVDAAMYLFGGLSLGFTVYESAMDQFNAGHQWSLPNTGGVEGGHCILQGRYVEDAGGRTTRRRTVTWGARQWMTEGFWRSNVTEANGVITPEWLNAQTGKTPTGLNLQSLGEAVADLTHGPNPFA